MTRSYFMVQSSNGPGVKMAPGAFAHSRRADALSLEPTHELGVDADGPERERVGAAEVDEQVAGDHPPVGAIRATGDAAVGALGGWWGDPGADTVRARA